MQYVDGIMRVNKTRIYLIFEISSSNLDARNFFKAQYHFIYSSLFSYFLQLFTLQLKAISLS